METRDFTQKTAGEHRSKSCWIWQSSWSLRKIGLLIWICVVWRANRDAKLELVTLDDARTAWCLYTPMVFMLLTWNSNLTHICQAKFARIEGQHGQGGQIRQGIVMIVCVCVWNYKVHDCSFSRWVENCTNKPTLSYSETAAYAVAQ